MNVNSPSPGFLTELVSTLPQGNANDRKRLAGRILDEKIDLKELCALLIQEKRVSQPFLWLLSELGMLDPNALHDLLPYLFSLRHKIQHVDLSTQLATYWLIAGVPEENEGEAVDLLFNLLRSAETSKTNKARAQKVLIKLQDKHPDLERELKLILEERTDQ